MKINGIYTNTGTSVITLTKTIAVMGGWDGGESSPPIHNSMLYPTILDGERARQVVAMLGDYSPTLDGFIIRNGYAHGSINNGGGIYISGCGAGFLPAVFIVGYGNLTYGSRVCEINFALPAWVSRFILGIM